MQEGQVEHNHDFDDGDEDECDINIDDLCKNLEFEFDDTESEDEDDDESDNVILNDDVTIVENLDILLQSATKDVDLSCGVNSVVAVTDSLMCEDAPVNNAGQDVCTDNSDMHHDSNSTDHDSNVMLMCLMYQ